MFRTTLRSLWSHKRRLISTCVAIILGVAFMAGTLVLNGTIGKVFDDLFADMGQGIDAQVRGAVLFESDQTGTQRGLLPDSLTEQVAAVPGVAAAEGSILTASATVVDSKGDALGGAGPPVFVGSWDTDSQLASYQVVEGRAPTADGEAIIDAGGADKGGFSIGDDVEVITGTARYTLELVGISRFGDADSAAGSVFVGTTLAQAQTIAGEPGKLNTVNARAEAGITPEQLVERIRQANLVPGLDVVTGEQASDEQASDLKSAFGFFTLMLTIFALIALFVGWFIISNTFSILVAQRTRELALLRAIGATRRQVMSSVLLEAVLIGLISGVVGLVAGVLLAFGGFNGLKAFGVDLPSAGLVIPPSAIGLAIAAGLLVTIVAAIMPAIRATRVPPIAALRSVAIDVSGRSKLRAAFGLLILLAGALLAKTAWTSQPTNDDVATVGMGVALLLVSVLVLGPVLAAPLARLLGSWIPLFKGITGKIARQNAMRSPRRTASTAAALIVGVTLISFITVFAQSATASISSALDSGFKGDYVVTPSNNFSMAGAPRSLVDAVRDVPGVQEVTAASATQAKVTQTDGSATEAFVGGTDPESAKGVFTFKMAEGTIDDLRPGTILVDRAVAEDKGIAIGDRLSLLSAKGRTLEVKVSALSNDPAMLGQWTITSEDLEKLDPEAGVFMMGLALDPGVGVDEIRSALRAAVEPYPQMKLQDREQFKSSIVSQITSLLMVIYVLLAVSVVISLIGIANTLSLAIHERTRELGLLRAMGMTRSQLRSSVRWEAVIIALIGALLGIGLGIGLSFLMVKVLSGQGITEFSAPPMMMIVITGGAALLGVLASLRPAWRASKLNVLEAIASE